MYVYFEFVINFVPSDAMFFDVASEQKKGSSYGWGWKTVGLFLI